MVRLLRSLTVHCVLEFAAIPLQTVFSLHLGDGTVASIHITSRAVRAVAVDGVHHPLPEGVPPSEGIGCSCLGLQEVTRRTAFFLVLGWARLGFAAWTLERLAQTRALVNTH